MQTGIMPPLSLDISRVQADSGRQLPSENPPQGPHRTVFVVVGSSQHGRFFRLHSRTITVGSSHQCTLRLVAKGVKPFHCVVIRGRKHVIYRSCQGVVNRDGIPFPEGCLAPGDIISVGPVNLMLLDGERVQPAAESDPLPAFPR